MRSRGRNVSARVSLLLIYVTFRVYARSKPSSNTVSRAGRVLKTLCWFGFPKTLRKFFRRVLRAASPKTRHFNASSTLAYNVCGACPQICTIMYGSVKLNKSACNTESFARL